MATKVFRFQPDQKDDGVRLDQYVPSATNELSRTLFRKILDIGGVHVGGRRTRKCSQPVRAGELIEVHVDGLSLDPFVLRDEHILYRDPYLIAINKPAGVDSQPTPSRFKGTIFEALQTFLQDPFKPTLTPSLGMVQRLDRDTSGVMVFSIHHRSNKRMTEIFSGREARKQYLALVRGVPSEKEGEIRSLLARARSTNRVKSVAAGGKEAITRYALVEEFDGASLLQVEILTGRSHQIRAHFSEMSLPLLGDKVYGGPAKLGLESIGRQMLHAQRLEFPHPVHGTEMVLEASLPADMELILNRLRNGQRA